MCLFLFQNAQKSIYLHCRTALSLAPIAVLYGTRNVIWTNGQKYREPQRMEGEPHFCFHPTYEILRLKTVTAWEQIRRIAIKQWVLQQLLQYIRYLILSSLLTNNNNFTPLKLLDWRSCDICAAVVKRRCGHHKFVVIRLREPIATRQHRRWLRLGQVTVNSWSVSRDRLRDSRLLGT